MDGSVHRPAAVDPSGTPVEVVPDPGTPGDVFVVRKAAGGAGHVSRSLDDDEQRRWPALAAWLTAGMWKGVARETGSITLFYEEGRVKAAVSDRDSGLVAFVSSETILGLLDKVQRGLASGDMDWRESRRKK